LPQLIEIDPGVKGIVSSGHSDDPVMIDFGKYGFCSAIAKPYSIPELSVILDKVITDTDLSGMKYSGVTAFLTCLIRSFARHSGVKL
jgi:hypothetical protein